LKEHNVELNGKLNISGDYEAGVTFNDLPVKAAKISFTGYESDSNGLAVKASSSYKHEQGTIKAGVKFPFKDDTHVNWNGEMTVCQDNIHAGVAAQYDQAVPGQGEEQVKDRILMNYKAGYLTPAFQAVVFAEDQVNKDKATSTAAPLLHLLNFNFLYSVTEAIKFGFGTTIERDNVRGTEVNAGGEYKVDKNTTVKGKFSVVQSPKPDDREFRLGFAVKQNLTERINVTVGADLNARAMLGTPTSLGSTKPHSFGFEVKFQ